MKKLIIIILLTSPILSFGQFVRDYYIGAQKVDNHTSRYFRNPEEFDRARYNVGIRLHKPNSKPFSFLYSGGLSYFRSVRERFSYNPGAKNYLTIDSTYTRNDHVYINLGVDCRAYFARKEKHRFYMATGTSLSIALFQIMKRETYHTPSGTNMSTEDKGFITFDEFYFGLKTAPGYELLFNNYSIFIEPSYTFSIDSQIRFVGFWGITSGITLF